MTLLYMETTAINMLRPTRYKRLFSCFLILAFLFSTSIVSAFTQTSLLDPAGEGSPAIDAEAFVLYDAQSGTFLLGKNQDVPLPPASITKVMTILLALEHLKLTDTLTTTRDMFESIPNDYTRLGLVEGEVITVEQALYACLLISANDAAMALAIKIGGSADTFADMMNARAIELGCTNTYFTNPYGLSDEDHLTTAHDMALILAEALKYEIYTQISTTKHYLMPATNKSVETRGLTNGNRFVSSANYAYENYIGGKTGYTSLSGYTIAAGARKDNRTLIAVLLDASSAKDRYTSLIDLFEYGFAAYCTEKVDPEEFEDIKNQTVAKVTAEIEEAGYALKISDVALNLCAYTTTTSAKEAGGHICSVDESQAAVQANLLNQVLSFALYRQYSDGTKILVGTLEMSVSEKQALETTAETTAEGADSQQKPTAGTIFVRVVLSILLAAVFVFCIMLFFIMLKKDLKRRRRSRRSRLL
jgi:D-alanyl-D-alanine carboxypeptidase